MRIERLRIDAFGRLRDLDTGEAPLGSLVVVEGPNEAGKTSFFSFLSCLLYGFYPASRDAHPYTPWEGGDIAGRATVRLDRGERVEVERRLLSAPAGTLVRADGVAEELRNTTLPFAKHVPRPVFGQVYALTLAELAGLQGESWAAVEDRLTGALGAADLLPARDVARRLEQEAGELWRPNRRGNQRVRTLREEIRALRVRRREAARSDGRLREAAAELERSRARLASAREERAAVRLRLERVRELLPLREQLARIDALEARAGDPAELEALPADPAERLRAVDAELADLDERAATLAQETREPRRAVEAHGSTDQKLLGREARIAELVARAAAAEPERVRIGQLEQEVRDLERRAREAGEAVLAVPWAELDRERLDAVDVQGLRVAAAALREAREERRVAEEAARAAGEHPAGPAVPPAAGWAAVLGGLALLAWGLAGGTAVAAAGGAALLAGGAAVLARSAGARARGAASAAGAGRVEARRRAEADARTAAALALGGLPVRDRLLDAPEDAAAAVARLRESAREAADREARLAEHRESVEGVRRDLAALGEELAVTLPPDAGAAAHLLDRQVRDAATRRDAARAAKRELERLGRERSRLRDRRLALGEEADGLRRSLADLGDGDVDEGLRRLRERRIAAERARGLLETLRRRHDPGSARERVRLAEEEDADWSLDDETLARDQGREEALSAEVESLEAAAARLASEVELLGEGDTVDALDGEIAAAEEALRALGRERDRRFLLARIVREAHRRVREEHQPDVVRLAGRHLAAITGGRYARILVGEGDRAGSFLLRGPGYPAPMDVAEPVSTGTREQVYLSLRLAIVDHLDRDGERLPLFMDEAFVNWDPDRRARGFDLLGEAAETRQVFVFTCHPDVARALVERGGHHVRLGPDPGVPGATV